MTMAYTVDRFSIRGEDRACGARASTFLINIDRSPGPGLHLLLAGPSPGRNRSGAFNGDLSSCPYTASMLASSMLNKINHKHAAYTDIHTIAYTCSGISVNSVVKLGDHVTYSIHDVAVSFMEIGKIVEIFRHRGRRMRFCLLRHFL
jgi:hypothetical protein